MNIPPRNDSHAYAGNLALVNSANLFVESIDPEKLLPVGPDSNGVLMERHAAALLNQLMYDIGAWRQIVAISGWRSLEEQREIWDNSLCSNGEAYTKQFVAFPGCSEHHTGLAIDLGLRQGSLDIICPEFPYTGICQVFRNKMHQYGFIQRYPAGKEHITGIAHEPWHFRYVGVPHAEVITRLCITLEEYIEMLQRFSTDGKPYTFQSDQYEFEIFYYREKQLSTHIPKANDTSLISVDNCGGVIITSWARRGE